MMADHGTCWRCRWFDRDETDADGEGYCRRFPPSVVPVDEDSIAQLFPSVEFLDWCGEYEGDE